MIDTKRLLLIIFVALWCLCSLPFANAQQCGEDQYASNTIVVKKKLGSVPAAGGGCDTSTNEVGSRAEGTGSPFSAGYAFASAGVSDCASTGTLETAYINHLDTSEAAVKICVYARTTSTPNVNDTKIGCSGEILSSTTTGWKTGSIGEGSVTASQNVWVVVLVNAAYNNWQGGIETVAPLFYQSTDTFAYASPPANMGAGWTDLGDNSPMSIYVRLQ